MQCRICFDDGDARTLLTPCLCRGTAAYIHQSCLDEYIRYYPDRTCRVCKGFFPAYQSPREIQLCWVLFLGLTSLLFFSTARLLVKFPLFGMITLLSIYFLRCNLLTSTPFVFIFILTLLFLPGGHASANYMWLTTIGMIAFVYTLARQLPAIILLGILVTAILAAYAGFILVLAYQNLDAPAFTVFFSVLYLVWYSWVHDNPLRLRYA